MMFETDKYVLVDNLDGNLEAFVSKDFDDILEVVKELLLESREDEGANLTNKEILDLYEEFKQKEIVEVPDIERTIQLVSVVRL